MPFAFDLKNPFLRINTTVILILSSINFKISVTTRLPTVSYLTILDRYAFPVLLYMDFLCFYHSIIGSSLFENIDNSTMKLYDLYFLFSFFTVYLLFHLVYISIFLHKFSKTYFIKNLKQPLLNKKIISPV